MAIPPQIRVGWIIDGSGRRVQTLQNIFIRHCMISKIAKPFEEKRPVDDPGNVSGHTILPGLIDCHVHLFMSGKKDPAIRQNQLTNPFKAVKPVIKKHLFDQLNCGIVALRDGSDHSGYALKYKNKHLQSDNLPIVLQTPGPAWRASGRYGKLIGSPPSAFQSLARGILSRSDSGDHIKIVNSGLNSLKEFAKQTAPQFKPDELNAAVKAAKDLGVKVMVHANGRVPVKQAIEAGCHSIEHGFFMGEENLRKMAEKEIFWTPTAYTMKAYHEFFEKTCPEKDIAIKNYDHQLEQIAKAAQFGVNICVGTDSGSPGVNHGISYRNELKALSAAGMSMEKVIQCATFNGAKLMGLENELGRINVGMPATFIVVQGRPEELPKAFDKPIRVFIRGEEWLPDDNIASKNPGPEGPGIGYS